MQAERPVDFVERSRKEKVRLKGEIVVGRYATDATKKATKES